MTRTEPPSVLYDVAEHVATITLNRPQARNAMDHAGYKLLSGCIERASADIDVRCIVITGTDPGFCAGDDIRILSGQDRHFGPDGKPEKLPLPGAALRRCTKPVVAAVNGPAMGYGLEIAVLSDFRLASEQARFCALYIRRSLVAPADSWEILPRIVGQERAAELLLTGDTIDAATALEYRLVSRVTAHADLLPEARALAARMARNAPLAVQAAKQALLLSRAGDRKGLRDHINAQTLALSATEDFRESIASFRERREPVYRGR
ncbi:MAG: enoyl-CoA hydratase/isomerase family protein [Gammaproteobacteria bacterium]